MVITEAITTEFRTAVATPITGNVHQQCTSNQLLCPPTVKYQVRIILPPAH